MARLPPHRQGDLGGYSAIEWLGSQGYAVFVPVGHSPDCDLIAERDGDLLRVRWTGLVKHFSRRRCDRLFVLVADGRRWFVPARSIAAKSMLRLGGPKYAAFEVEPGSPLSSKTTG